MSGYDKEHNGVRYKQVNNGWELQWPSGIKTNAKNSSEEDLKTKIDDLQKQING